MLKEFRDFIARGNVLDLAVAVIIAGAFGKIVATFTEGIVMPVVGLFTGGVNFAQKVLLLGTCPAGADCSTLDKAKAAGVAYLSYGQLINDIINFLIVAFVMFMIVRSYNKMKQAQEEAPAGPTPTETLLAEIRDLLQK
jgi:large conductance mechanosensitive channel